MTHLDVAVLVGWSAAAAATGRYFNQAKGAAGRSKDRPLRSASLGVVLNFKRGPRRSDFGWERGCFWRAGSRQLLLLRCCSVGCQKSGTVQKIRFGFCKKFRVSILPTAGQKSDSPTKRRSKKRWMGQNVERKKRRLGKNIEDNKVDVFSVDVFYRRRF